MVSVSQWEREAIGERTATALQHKRSQGKVYSRIVPFGFCRDGDQLVPIAAEQAVIARIKKLRITGLSLREIAAVLNGDDIKTKQGSWWQPQTVSDVLKNPLHSAIAVAA
jgi:site-specific DNA recombinase